MSNVDLNVAMDSALVGSSSTTAAPEKKRTREKKLPFPDLPDKKRFFPDVLDVNPRTHSCPPERLFVDPLVFTKTKRKFAENLVIFMDEEIARLDAIPLETRVAEKKAKLEKQAALRALKSDAVKTALSADPTIMDGVLSGLSAEQLVAIQARLNGILAKKATE